MSFKLKKIFIIYENGDSSSGLFVFLPIKNFLTILRVEINLKKNNKAFILANLNKIYNNNSINYKSLL
jgi:hypothetical protein